MFDAAQELSENVLHKFYIGGEWVDPIGTQHVAIVHPANQQVVAHVPLASTADIDHALAAAREAFDAGPWPHLSPSKRGDMVALLADALHLRISLFEKMWTAQVGVPVRLAKTIAPSGIKRLDYFAKLATTFEFEEERPTGNGSARIRREPVGVAALIVPWNATFPILLQKLGPALVAGCTCIIKSSPESPLEALLIAEVAASIGIPAGVINVITADRDESAYLVASPLIDKVTFTGSFAAGRSILASAADNMTRVTLELGGKSAAILLDDVDLDAAVPALTPFLMPFSGQFCFSQTRILAPRSRLEEIIAAFSQAIAAIVVGDPWDPTTQLGPVLNQRQLVRTLGYIAGAKQEGAELVTGGERDGRFPNGFFVQPTVFANVRPEMTIAREEVFGPVIIIEAYEDDEDAIVLANATDYGLSGTIFSVDTDRAYRMACRIRTGQIGINHLQLSPAAPFGGFKRSGIGREGGPEGLGAFLETKAIFLPAAQ